MLSRQLLSLVVAAVVGASGPADASSLAKATVETGLDVLIRSGYSNLRGKKVLILTNPTGITPDLDLGVDVMVESGSVDVVGVMGPEHGFRGTSQNGNGEASFVDAKTGLTVYDAYDVNTTVIQSYIEASGADTLLFDIQDVGARFYTYTWAMYDSMVAAAMSNISFVVLDRPNPLTGLGAFGPVLNESFVSSYVGRRAVAQAHGMTAGELARMFVGEGWIRDSAGGLDLPSLDVIQMKGWKRAMDFGATKLPWVMPSPNMPTLQTAMLYPGTCMFEGTSISEGRGTTRPFEIMGAPWTNESWTTAMRDLQIPYTDYRFQCFTPTTSKFTGTVSCGLQTYAAVNTDYEHSTFDPVYVGVSLLWTARRLYASGSTEPNEGNYTASFHWRQNGDYYDIDLLVGSPLVREGIEAGLTPSEIKAEWKSELDLFKKKRAKYLLYWD